MNVAAILQSSRLPLTAQQIADRLGMAIEEVYTDLVRMEGEGRARPILNYFHRENRVGIAGWIASPYWSN
jgi:predicted Rossmann fold nucleotide-binding protein DprA/Smf involved in DNA uptake